MCGGLVGKVLDVVGINPASAAADSAKQAQADAEARATKQTAEAEQKAATAANAQTQMARRALRENSLLSSDSARTTLGV